MTHAHKRDPAKPFHIDYAFVSTSLMTDRTALAVPPVDEWLKLSDHGPLILDI